MPRSPRRLLPLLLAAACALVNPALAQSARDRLNAVIEGLNDPDPIVRLVTFEEAVGSGDATVQRIALRTALESTDSDLRALALRGAFANRKHVTFQLSRTDEHEQALDAAGDNEQKLEKVRKAYQSNEGLLQQYSGVLPIQIQSYDYQSGTISGICMTDLSEPDERYAVTGNIAGDEVSLTATCHASSYSNCTLTAELGDSGTLEGAYSCSYYGAKAEAKLDLL